MGLLQEHYYDGLPSRPKLIARSGTEPWAVRWIPGPWEAHLAKDLTYIGRHPIVEPWNDANGPLRRAVLAALEGTAWTSIDILRIGYANEDTMPTLFVSVEPGSTDPEAGFSIMTQIKAILSEHGFHDIDCDVKEGAVVPLAILLSRARDAPTGPAALPAFRISDCLGTSIGPLATDGTEVGFSGTKGLHLRLRKDNGDVVTVALTCRHVVFDAQADDGATYKYDPSMPKRMVMQSLGKHFQSIMDDFTSGAFQQNPAVAQLQQEYSAITSPTSRAIGHILFAPPYELVDGRWWRDWALIELHQDRHAARLFGPGTNIENRVWLEPTETHKMFHSAMSKEKKLRTEVPTPIGDINDTMALSHEIIPEAQLRHPSTLNAMDDAVLIVGKYGANTSLTFGFGNQVKSLVRRPGGRNRDYTSEEWCVVGGRRESGARREDFSVPGDSGSVIWDMNQRIGGMITAGVGARSGIEVTYATPMELLLEDIRSFGFNVEIP
ncbi:hypothetical protein HJFPF1_02464 [Paramyrothecium foliicola]|nr:hypothetical protein HJFPF1_02464 [Paramyrothecium foliicola]